jgi:rSAM/selenodomain-associated transferase 1
MIKQRSNARLLVFARAPCLGQVKTRLSASIGDANALRLYRAMLGRLGALLEGMDWDLWVTSNKFHKDFLSICKSKNICDQKEGDLGQRMLHAISCSLAQESIEFVVLIGTDCPALEPAYLECAFEALQEGVEVVLGPAEDGGYVLVGMRQPVPEIFSNINWGSGTVLEETVQRLRQLGLSYRLLETLWDVDTVEDLPRLRELSPPLLWKFN